MANNDKGVLKNPESLSGYDNQEGSLRFADQVAYGENPDGFTAFTPNGPSRVRKGETVLKDNFGEREDGDQYRWQNYGDVPVVARPLKKK